MLLSEIFEDYLNKIWLDWKCRLHVIDLHMLTMTFLRWESITKSFLLSTVVSCGLLRSAPLLLWSCRGTLWVPVAGCQHVQSPLVCNLTKAFSVRDQQYFTRISALLDSQPATVVILPVFEPIKNSKLQHSEFRCWIKGLIMEMASRDASSFLPATPSCSLHLNFCFSSFEAENISPLHFLFPFSSLWPWLWHSWTDLLSSLDFSCSLIYSSATNKL